MPAVASMFTVLSEGPHNFYILMASAWWKNRHYLFLRLGQTWPVFKPSTSHIWSEYSNTELPYLKNNFHNFIINVIVCWNFAWDIKHKHLQISFKVHGPFFIYSGTKTLNLLFQVCPLCYILTWTGFKCFNTFLNFVLILNCIFLQ